MFKLALSPMFWATCKVQFADENGKQMTGAFGVQFKRHNRTELDALSAEIREGVTNGSVTNHDSEFVRRVVTGFRDIEVTDPRDGSTITADNTPAMIDYLVNAGFGVAMVKTFYDEYPKARAKN